MDEGWPLDVTALVQALMSSKWGGNGYWTFVVFSAAMPYLYGRRLCVENITNMQDLIAKAATLLEALPYIQKFSETTFIVKYGGSFMDSPDPAVRDGVARDI